MIVKSSCVAKVFAIPSPSGTSYAWGIHYAFANHREWNWMRKPWSLHNNFITNHKKRVQLFLFTSPYDILKKPALTLNFLEVF